MKPDKPDLIRSFYWAATLKNVTLAAGQCGTAQSTMTEHLTRLEREKKVVLFDRAHEFRLTPEGERLLALVERLFDAQREVAEFGAPLHVVPLRIGVIESVAHSWLTPWLEQLHTEQPELELELELTVATTAALDKLMRGGALDVMVAALAAGDEGVETRALPSMAMAFVGHRALHERDQYTLAELAEQPLLTFQRGSQPFRKLHELLRAARLEAARVRSLSSISVMVKSVEKGLGIATLPFKVLEQLGEHTPLRALTCDQVLPALPLYASFRQRPETSGLDRLVQSALSFIATF